MVSPTFTTITMLPRYRKAMVHTPYNDILGHCRWRIAKRHINTIYFYSAKITYFKVQRTNKMKWFQIKKKKKQLADDIL